MAFTGHGHHIPGTVKNGTRPVMVMRCGGPRLCKTCVSDVNRYFERVREKEIKDAKLKNIPVTMQGIRVGLAHMTNDKIIVEIKVSPGAHEMLKDLIRSGLSYDFSITPIVPEKAD